MINFLILLAVVVIFLAVGSVIYYFSLFKKVDEKLKDRPHVTNSMPKYTNGYKEGVLIRNIEQADWTAVEFLPRDIDYEKLKKEKKKIKPEVIFVPSNNLEWIPRGGWSNQVSDLIINPISEEDIPKGLKNTSIGDGFRISAIKGERERVEERMEKIITDSIERIQKNTKGEEILEKYQEIEKGMRENMNTNKTEEVKPKK